MDSSRHLECLAADFARLREVAARDLSASVPSCPGWSVTDLVRHVAGVYLHKVEAMRQGHPPAEWPPPGLATEESIPLLDRAYRALSGEFARRQPDDRAWTWFDDDQTVRFWIRRMAQETVIHRVDAELALGEELAPIPDDLAVDGTDEVLRVFLAYGSTRWREHMSDALAEWGERSLLVDAGGERWRVGVHPTGVEISDEHGPTAKDGHVEEDGRADADGHTEASIRGKPAAVLLWLWNRGGTEAAAEGDAVMFDELRRLLTVTTQ
jgi:uncharacterized protein (TIGR03083 family)